LCILDELKKSKWAIFKPVEKDESSDDELATLVRNVEHSSHLKKSQCTAVKKARLDEHVTPNKELVTSTREIKLLRRKPPVRRNSKWSQFQSSGSDQPFQVSDYTD